MMLRSILAFLLAIMLSAPLHAATILVWGDSLSAGYGLAPREDWPTLLQTRLAREGFQHRVINGSMSGETTAGGRSRLPAALERHGPELLILELGANDGLRGLKPKRMAENLDAMIRLAQARGTRVLLIGMQLPPNYGQEYNLRFQQAFADVASKHRVPLVPFLLDGFADRPEFFLADGLHPTAEAQTLIVETVWRKLVALLAH